MPEDGYRSIAIACDKCGASNSIITQRMTENLPVRCSKCGSDLGQLLDSRPDGDASADAGLNAKERPEAF